MDVALSCFARQLTTLCTVVSCHLYSEAMQIQNAFVTKLWHVFIFIFYVISGFVLFSWGYEIVHYFPILNSLCPEETCNVILVYRLALAIIVFHLFLALILYGLSSGESDRAKFQNASWGLKFPLLLFLLVLCAFVPESLLIIFGWIALISALVFIIIQLVLVIHFAYGVVEMSIAIDRLDYEETDGAVAPGNATNPWRGLIIILSILMTLTSVILVLYGWMLLGELPDCHINISILVIYVILILVTAIFTLHPKVQRQIPTMGLFQLSTIALYATFLLWNAIVVDDPGQCTADFIVGSTVYWVTLLIGTLYAVGLVYYCSIPRPGETSDCYNYSKVNLFYAFAAAYLAMLLTNWSVVRRYGDEAHEVEMSLGWLPVIFWVLSMFVLVFMFLISLMGHMFCADRFKDDAATATTATTTKKPHRRPGAVVSMDMDDV